MQHATLDIRQQNSDTIQQAIDMLPVANPALIYTINPDGAYMEAQNHKAIMVKDSVVACPSKKYVLVQHKDAFFPVMEGLKVANIPYKFSLWATPGRANLKVFTDQCIDGVNIGFSVLNSFDSTSAISYGMRMFASKTTIELAGFRQVCSNGMKIKVPLNDAEIIGLETVTKIKELFKEQARIAHYGAKVKERIASMQYIAEAITMLRDPVNRIIERSQEWTIDNEEVLKTLIKRYVGKRFSDTIYQRYNIDRAEIGANAYALYNAITYVASHDNRITAPGAEHLQDRAANMLMELRPITV